MQLTDSQRQYVREEMAKVSKHQRFGFARWLVRIITTDPMGDWA